MIDEPPSEETKEKLEEEAERGRRMLRQQVRKHAVRLIQLERRKQVEKWGFRAGPENPRNAVEWLAILTEEVGELAEACVERHFDSTPIDRIRQEAIQTAAVALAIVEACERGHHAIPARRHMPEGVEEKVDRLHSLLCDPGDHITTLDYRHAKRIVRDLQEDFGG